MTGPDPADAGQPDNTATPQQIVAIVASLNIPHRSPHTVYEVCRCCGQPTGTYWAIPRSWEPTA